MLKNQTQPTTIYKVKAHTNIDKNEQADQLAKNAPKRDIDLLPYYYQKDTWLGPAKRHDKGPIRCLETYITNHDIDNNLKTMSEQFPNINKWTINPDIDNKISNNFWSNPEISYPQKTCKLKFRTGQYMANAIKQLFLGIERFPSITCPICNSNEADT